MKYIPLFLLSLIATALCYGQTPALTKLTYDGGTTFADGTNLTANTLHSITAVANTATVSVVFVRDGVTVKTDSASPFDFAWKPTSTGAHTFSATPWSMSAAMGVSGPPINVNFNVVAASPTPTPTPTPTPSATPTPTPPGNGQFIYCATDRGTVNVYDINNNHSLVKTFRFTNLTTIDVRGIAAAVPTHRLYVMYNASSLGHLVAIDLLNNQILWDKTGYSQKVDRGDVTPDGSKFYLPSNETINLPYESVVDAITGNQITRITQPVMTHDTIVTLDGTLVFMENKNTTDKRVHTISVSSDTQTAQTDQFANVVQPFTLNATNSIMYANVMHVYGFQYADATTGAILGTGLFSGTTYNGTKWPHGIALTPDGHQLWVSDRGTGNHYVHIFDASASPPTTQIKLLTVSNDNPHWICFSIDGRFGYVSGEKGLAEPFDVFNVATWTKLLSLPASEDIIEVDFSGGAVSAVGKQFGIGR